MSALAARIQNALRAMAAQDCENVVVAPYAAYIDHENALPFFSYAIPQQSAAAPWARGPIDQLAAVFRAASREPRFEIVASCWPGLADALTGAGFRVEASLAGLVCAAGDLRDAAGPAGLELEHVDRRSSDAAIADLQRVKFAPFDDVERAPVDDAAIARYRRTGAAAVIARLPDGVVAGSATWLGVQDGVSEIAAVGVLHEHRGQGIAAALTAAAGRAAVGAGADLLFLTFEDPGAGRVYARAGFSEDRTCAVLKLAAREPARRR